MTTLVVVFILAGMVAFALHKTRPRRRSIGSIAHARHPDHDVDGPNAPHFDRVP